LDWLNSDRRRSLSIPGAERYDGTTIALHWLTAALVVALWGIAQAEELVPKPDRHLLWSVHIIVGAALAVVLTARVAWRARHGAHLPSSDAGVLGVVARAAHWALYTLVAIAVVLGFVNLAVRGWDFGGVVTLPGWAPDDRALRRTINDWHELAANMTLVVAALHAATALVHHYVLRDGVLRRMSFAKARR
jgi:cytochrome b561